MWLRAIKQGFDRALHLSSLLYEAQACVPCIPQLCPWAATATAAFSQRDFSPCFRSIYSLPKLSAFCATSGNVLFHVYSSLLFPQGSHALALCRSKSRLLIPGGDRDGQVSEHGCFLISEGCSHGRQPSCFPSAALSQAPGLRTGAGSWLLPPCSTAREGRCHRNAFRTSRAHGTTTHPGLGCTFLL